jgi:formate hydrogenlyase subunit 3/multisubunit Na+/H+ antiporter MnhD subunit
MPAWLWLAPLPGLALAVFGEHGAMAEFLSMAFRLDTAGVLLLAASAALWMVAAWTVPAYLQKKPGGSFVICWLMTLTGSLGVFAAADLIGFLVFYALVSLPAYGLVTFEGSPEARRAGKIYLGFALLGENILLLAFVMLGVGEEAAFPPVLLLVLVGFGMKMALLPLHFWMPLTYTAAPIPAAAVLSGAGVKAGVVGMLMFLPFDEALPVWGEVLTMVGFCGAFYGVAVGLTQTNPKTVLAYSSVSQMGFLAAVLGLGLSAGDEAVVPLAAFYAAHHVLAKGALFLAIGVSGARRCLVLGPATLLGLGLAGLPLTGGALAKLAVKDPLGYGIAATLASLSAAGTALLMMHFVFRLAEARQEKKKQTGGSLAAWLVGAALCLVFPWISFSLAGLALEEIVAPAALWKTLWPVVLGVLGALALRRFRLPKMPVGDIVVLAGKIPKWAAVVGRAGERFNAKLSLWPVACLSLLAIVLLLLAAFASRF